MKKQIHPKWFPEAKVTCVCGNTFTIGATVPELNVEVCYQCHPFYTGQMRFTGGAGRVEKFQAKQTSAKKKILSKTQRMALKRQKRIKQKYSGLESLSELRKSAKKK